MGILFLSVDLVEMQTAFLAAFSTTQQPPPEADGAANSSPASTAVPGRIQVEVAVVRAY